MVTFGDVHQQMSGKNSNWLSDIKQCIHYKEPDLDCTLPVPFCGMDRQKSNFSLVSDTLSVRGC